MFTYSSVQSYQETSSGLPELQESGNPERGSLNSANPKNVPVGTRREIASLPEGGRSPRPHGILTLVDQPYTINRINRIYDSYINTYTYTYIYIYIYTYIYIEIHTHTHIYICINIYGTPPPPPAGRQGLDSRLLSSR